MADNFPTFPFTTQEDWYGELSFFSADDGSELSLEGRNFVMLITPATSGAALVEPKIVLTMDVGGGLSLKNGDPSTIIFRVPKETAGDLQRMEYTADVLEVVGGNRYLFMPARIQYFEPSALRTFLSRFLGVKVSFAARRQPIITPVAVPGREGKPGATILQGSTPPGPNDGKDNDYYIEDRTASGQGRRMYGPKTGGQWPPTPWNIQVARISDVPGLTSALADKASLAQLAGKASIGITPISNESRICTPDDVMIAVQSISQPIAVFLPDAESYPYGQVLTVVDVSGACSPTNYIQVYPGQGSGDTIADADGNLVVIEQPYFAVKFSRGKANLWVRV